MNEDERAIRDLVRNWMESTKAGDIAAVLELMTDDILFLVPGAEPFGKQEFAAGAAGMKEMRFEGSCEVVEIEILGDRAWIRNRIEVTMTPAGGTPVHRAGYTLGILRKEGGRWRLARDANLVTAR